MTVTGGAEWPRSWPRRLGGDGGGDSDQKRSETAPVLNGVCGGGKQGFSNRAQKERLFNTPAGPVCATALLWPRHSVLAIKKCAETGAFLIFKLRK